MNRKENMRRVNNLKRNERDKQIIGNQFNYLVVIGKSAKKSKNGIRHFWCQCTKCGGLRCVAGTDLKNGRAKQCKNCANKTHDKSRNNNPEYCTWINMKSRCLNKNSEDYKWYGERGITVCKRWKNSFQNFLNDMGNKPTSKHSIERIDNNKGYYPENCKWEIPTKQTWNRRGRSSSNSKFKGVWKQGNKWEASITRNKITYYLGLFDTEIEAKETYENKRIDLERSK